ncbi:LOW QUALITY PROTEIN: hypothetical protein HID58_091185 [Brassica napus]|uniref:Uncharacterized protein n=1 Tax=Brassica napus TaxID=3708 RepID=A0ABQ7X4R1_BRANA|nr:LOW QUALITY PROTEIN: hypothetical protein HID58_091185 [Brassica napus]
MKKNSMRKNKKLVINIASRKKELNKSSGSGSSIKDEKKRRRDVFDQRVCSKPDEEIDHHGSHDHSRVGDGVMREVGTYRLSGALKLLREQGTFKEIKSSSKHHSSDRAVERMRQVHAELKSRN